MGVLLIFVAPSKAPAREMRGRYMGDTCGAGMYRMDYGAAAMEAVFGGRLRPSTEGGRALMVACGSRHMWVRVMVTCW